MRIDELEALFRLGYTTPLSGREDDDDTSDDFTDESEDDTEEDNESDTEDEDESSETTVSLAEYNRLKRIAAESDRAKKIAEREARKRRERERAESGQWQELLDEREEHVKELEAERDEANYALDNFKRENRVTKAATRLGFRDPSDAFRFLSEDETEDDVTAERALKRLAREKPYLVEIKRSSGIPVNGEAGGLSMEEISRMSPDQINARWAEVQAAMAAGGTGS